MLLDVKQMDPKFELWYKEFMSTRFPELAHFELIFDTGSYTASQDEKGRYVINMDKGVALAVGRLPKKVKAVYKNSAAGELNIYWDVSALNYNPNKSGEQVLYAGFESGIYNPLKLTPELIMQIARSEKLSLRDWWKNGAMIQETSFADAEDLSILTDYYITNLTGAFDGAENIVNLPELAVQKEGDITNLDYTFRDCKRLTEVPVIETGAVTSYVETFYNCKSLKAAFPYTLDMSHVTSREQISNVFGNSSVKTVTIKYAGETVPEFLCPLFMGPQLEKITIVDNDGVVKAVRTQADNPSIVSYLSPGENNLIVPAGVTKAKVALVSGANYEFTSSWHGNKSVNGLLVRNKVSAIKRGDVDVITSNAAAGVKGNAFDYMGSQEQHGGIPAEFDATYEDYSKKVYCCGIGAGRQAPRYYTHAWEALENTFVQDEIDVTPGEELTISVAAGGYTKDSMVDAWNKKPSDGEFGGYVLLQFM